MNTSRRPGSEPERRCCWFIPPNIRIPSSDTGFARLPVTESRAEAVGSKRLANGGPQIPAEVCGEATLDLPSHLRRTPLGPLGHARRPGRPVSWERGTSSCCASRFPSVSAPSAWRPGSTLTVHVEGGCGSTAPESFLHDFWNDPSEAGAASRGRASRCGTGPAVGHLV
jgi:hypothetical protein